MDNSIPRKDKGKYRIELLRPGCINCEACNKLNPSFWSLDADDKKSHLINSNNKKNPSGLILKEWVFSDDISNHLMVAECCPTKVIRVYDDKTGKRLDGFELLDKNLN